MQIQSFINLISRYGGKMFTVAGEVLGSIILVLGLFVLVAMWLRMIHRIYSLVAGLISLGVLLTPHIMFINWYMHLLFKNVPIDEMVELAVTAPWGYLYALWVINSLQILIFAIGAILYFFIKRD